MQTIVYFLCELYTCECLIVQPGLTEETRKAIGEAAVRAAAAVNYVGAGNNNNITHWRSLKYPMGLLICITSALFRRTVNVSVFVPFGNDIYVVLWCCLLITLKRSKMLLMKL